MIKSMTGGPVDEVGDEVVQISVPEKGCRILDRTNHKTLKNPGRWELLRRGPCGSLRAC